MLCLFLMRDFLEDRGNCHRDLLGEQIKLFKHHLPQVGGDPELFLHREHSIAKSSTDIGCRSEYATGDHLGNSSGSAQLFCSDDILPIQNANSKVTVLGQGRPKKRETEAIVVDGQRKIITGNFHLSRKKTQPEMRQLTGRHLALMIYDFYNIIDLGPQRFINSRI